MKEKGFTLIELMIVVAIIAIIAAIAIPNLMRARLAANESSAIATLRTISSAQETFRSSIIKDQDTDGLGEYGLLSEMCGTVAGPGMAAVASPPFLDPQVGSGNKSGYLFSVRVGPTAVGAGGGAITPAISASEVVYDAFCHPIAYSRSGNRSFTIDASGVIRQTDMGAQQAAGASPGLVAWSTWPVVGG